MKSMRYKSGQMNVNELDDWNRAKRRARPFIFANVLFFKDKSKKIYSIAE